MVPSRPYGIPLGTGFFDLMGNMNAVTDVQEVGTVSPTLRGDRLVIQPRGALGLLGLLGLGLLLLGRLPT